MSIWNPFSKTDDQTLEDALEELQKQSAGFGSQGPGLGSQGPGLGLPGLTVPPTPLLTPQQLSQILTAASMGLTPDEKVEFDKLTEEHKVNVKVAKISAFKKLHTDLRQFVINFFSWQEAVATINQTQVEAPERLKELQLKEQHGKLFTQGLGQYIGGHSYHISADGLMSFSTQLALPEGVTVEDLRQAHIEATLEEEMLDEK